MKAYYFTHKGKRENNQDYLIADNENGIFIITDGIGGYDFGEVASKIVAESCHFFLLNNRVTDEVLANEMLSFIQDRLIIYVKKNPNHIGMGTTLACIQFQENSVSIMHIGDSRVYHLDSQSKSSYWRTRDDSYVQELVEAEIISKREAEKHKYRNRLTKSILVKEKQEERSISFKRITKLKQKDILFLCTDGIFESVSENFLLQVLREEKNGEKIKEKLEALSKELSSDNTTTIYIEFMK